jgi:Protein of unknown function (DUF664)
VKPSLLLDELNRQRKHVVETLDGLTDEQQRTALPPRTWAPLSALHHLAMDVERWWFQAIVANDPQAWAYFDANPDGAWALPDGVDAAALYAAESAKSDAIILAVGPDATPAAWSEFLGPVKSVGEIVLHVIGETAAHAGQLDVVRELIDGHQHLVMD